MARVSRVSPRYNDRILHDDEEKKSEIGKGYREGIIFLFFIEFTFKRSLRLLSFFPIKKLLSIHTVSVDRGKYFLTFLYRYLFPHAG